MKKITIGIIGLGYWGPNLLRNFFKLDEVKVVGGCDLKEENLAKIKKYYPLIKLTKDYQDLLRDPEIEAVAIATPVSSHFQLAREALQQGKHVLIEKPMTRTTSEAQELIELAEKNQKTLMVDHTFLYTGAVRKIKELVSQGELGKLSYLSSQRINLGILQPDVNVVWDLAPHDISIIDYLVEAEPLSVSAIGSSYLREGIEEMAHIMVKFSNDITAYIYVSWLSPIKLRQTIIGGSKKMIVYNDIEPVEKIKVYDRRIDIDFKTETPAIPIYRSGDIYIPNISTREALEEECEHFVDCLKNRRKPLTDGQAGLRVVRVLEAIDKSMKNKGKEILIS